MLANAFAEEATGLSVASSPPFDVSGEDADLDKHRESLSGSAASL
jgi:hypothetical protein